MLPFRKRVPLRWIALFSVAVNLLMVVPPLHMLQLYDRVLPSRSWETLVYVTLIAVVAMALYGVAEAVRGQLAQRAAAGFAARSGEPLIAALARKAPSEAADGLRDFASLRSFLASRSFTGLFDLPFVPLFVGLMFLLHWSLGLLTCLGVALLVAIAAINRAVTSAPTASARKGEAQAIAFAQQAMLRGAELRAAGALPATVERWGTRYADALVTADAAAGHANGLQGLSKAVRRILQIAIMAWGAALVLQGGLSAGAIFAASMIVGRALAPVEAVIGGWDRIAEARRIDAELDALLDTQDAPVPLALPEPVGRLTVEGVVFAPHGPGHAPVLAGVNLTVEPGEVVAIVGPSGAGKTSLARMLAGIAMPQRGEVRLDGATRPQWADADWARHVGHVPQDVFFLPGTVAEIIARCDVEPDEPSVVAAATAAGVHEMILAMPAGYSTPVGEASGHMPLAGGQKQRLALARALYRDPKVVVLDEPNAHLDAAGERALLDAIGRLRAAGKAVVVTAQRRSLLKAADRTLSLTNGVLAPFLEAQSRVRVAAPSVQMPEPAPTKSKEDAA